MVGLRPAETAEGAEGKSRAVVFDKDQKTIKQIDPSGGHQCAHEIKRIAHAVVGERRHSVGAVANGKGVVGDGLEIAMEQSAQGLPIPSGNIDHGLEVLGIGVMLPYEALFHDQERRIDDQRSDQKEQCITEIVGYPVLYGCSSHWKPPVTILPSILPYLHV